MLLSGFADESSESKLLNEQFAVMSALGLKYLSLRFVDAGKGIKNVLELDEEEVAAVKAALEKFDLQISSIGSPIGKVKLFDFDDGSNNQYFEPNAYLENQVRVACSLANEFNTKLIRGFSFYHPRGEDPGQYVQDAAQRLASICEVCDAHGLTFGLEVEANLIGQNADLLMQLYESVDSDAMVVIFDGANLVTQGYTTSQIIDQCRHMLPALGWIHIKDYAPITSQSTDDFVDEEALNQFVPAGDGASDYRTILQLIRDNYSTIKHRLMNRGIPGLFADLEPHLRKGGQFGGFSGPDGFGIACRKFVQLCKQVDVKCQLAALDTMKGRGLAEYGRG